MKTKLFAYILIFLFVAILGFPYTETFYVSADGDGSTPEVEDADHCWDADDFSTAGNWSSDAQTNDGKVGPDDLVIFMSDNGTITGSASDGVLDVATSIDGTEAHPITLQGDGSAVIDGEDTRRCLDLVSSDYFIIENLEMTQGYGSNIRFYNCDHLTVQNCSLHDAHTYSDTTGSCASGYGDNNLWEYNDIYNTTKQHGIYFGDDADTDVSSNNTVQYNYIHDIDQNGIYYNGEGTARMTGNVVQFNWFEDCPYDSEGASICDSQNDGLVVRGNIFYENDSSASGQYCIRMEDSDENGYEAINTKIYNNTVVGDWKAMISCGEYTDGDFDSIHNNIFYQTSGKTNNYFIALYSAGDVIDTSDYNQFYDTVADSDLFLVTGGGDSSPDSLAAWVSETSLDTHSTQSDPSFTAVGSANFSLAEDSPCINTGTDLGDSYDDILPRNITKGDFGRGETITLVDQDDYGAGWERGAIVCEEIGNKLVMVLLSQVFLWILLPLLLMGNIAGGYALVRMNCTIRSHETRISWFENGDNFEAWYELHKYLGGPE